MRMGLWERMALGANIGVGEIVGELDCRPGEECARTMLGATCGVRSVEVGAGIVAAQAALGGGEGERAIGCDGWNTGVEVSLTGVKGACSS
jgi:hypothetical protein